MSDDEVGSIGTAYQEAKIETSGVLCPRNCQIMSDRAGGVWVWRKPQEPPVNPSDRCFVHVRIDEEMVWLSPRVFPGGTQLTVRP